jgi:cell division septation protein DedD
MKKYHNILGVALLGIALLFSDSTVYSQSSDDEIRSAIEKIDAGDTDPVRAILPDLVAKYQNNPGIMYIQGRLATDGIEAVKFYQGIVDNFPKSEWADDALYHIYQYYYSLGLYRTADLKMQQLKKEYPSSQYLTGKVEVKLPEKEEAPVKLPEKEIAPPDTQQAAESVPTPVPVSEPYTVQVGAFSTAAKAEKQKSFFEDRGYTVEVTNKIRAGKSFYLVWVGNFKNVQEARATVQEIKKKYKIDSMIVEK